MLQNISYSVLNNVRDNGFTFYYDKYEDRLVLKGTNFSLEGTAITEL